MPKPEGKTVGLLALIIVAAVEGYGYLEANNQTNLLEQENRRLVAKYYELNATYFSLLSDYERLDSSYQEIEQTYEDLRADYTNLQSSYNELESEHEELQTEYSALSAEYQSYRTNHGYTNSEYSQLQTQYDNLDDRLSRILGVTVKQFYVWTIPGESFWGQLFGISETWSWELPIPISLYVDYLEKERPVAWSDWVDMARDPDDRFYVRSLVQQINTVAFEEGFTEKRKIEFTIAFIQSLPYTVDSDTTPWDEYPRYPIETLFDRGGDCEDTSILAATLLREMGYHVALLVLPAADPCHCAVGVALSSASGTYYEYEGEKYFYLETTGEGWELGKIPSSYSGASAYVYKVD